MHPVIVGNELRVPVSYNGGCAPHTFAPVYRRQTMGPIVWLTHVSTDTCTTPVRQWVSIPLPADAHAMNVVWLFGPTDLHLQLQVP